MESLYPLLSFLRSGYLPVVAFRIYTPPFGGLPTPPTVPKLCFLKYPQFSAFGPGISR